MRAEPYRIDNRELRITTSIGISLFPDHGSDDLTLLNNADMAMYHAKKSGRNNCKLFNIDMNTLGGQLSHTEPLCVWCQRHSSHC